MKNIWFFFRGDYRKKCDNHVIRSTNHEINLQKITKNSLAVFDEQRCFKKNLKGSLEIDGK